MASLTTWNDSGSGRPKARTALAARGAPAAALAALSAPEPGDIADIVAKIRRHLGWIAFCLVAAWALGFAYLLFANPSYTATAQLFIDPSRRKVVSDEVIQNGVGNDIALFESQISIMGSDSILRRVVDAERLVDDIEFTPVQRPGMLVRLRTVLKQPTRPPDTMTVALAGLARVLRVRRVQNTYVINVDVTSDDPVKAARVANALSKAYLDDQADAKAEAAHKANNLIDARLDELKDQVRRAETNVDQFRRANRIMTSEGGLLDEQQLTKLNTELVGVRTLLAATKARLDELTSTLKRGISAESLPEAMNSPVIQKLRDQLATVARREASLNAQFQPRHPVLVEVRAQMSAIKSQIAGELSRITAATQSEYQIAINREAEIGRTLGRSQDTVSTSATAQIKLRELEREAEASREILRAFLARAKETQEQQNITIADARVIGPAAVPSKPSNPNPWIVVALSTLAGLGAGLGRALWPAPGGARAPAASTIGAAAALAGPMIANPAGPAPKPFARLPVLALGNPRGRSLRHLKSGAGASETPAFGDFIAAMSDGRRDANTPYRQAILRLYDKLRARARRSGPQIVLLVGAEAGDGTSSTALSLAYAATASGERTLLVDAASGNAALSNVFAGDILQERACVLDDKDDLAAICARDSRSGLTLLPIALADLRQLRLSQRQRFAIGLKNLAADFDFVVIDGSQPLTDEAIATLAPLAEPILVATRTDADHAGLIAEMAEALEIPADRIGGAVVTQSGVAALR